MNSSQLHESGRAYFFNDKEIYDGLVSAKLRISDRSVRILAKERGIFISGSDSREDIIKYLSLLNHGASFFAKIQENMEVTAKRPRTTMSRWQHEGQVTPDVLSAALTELKEERGNCDGETLRIVKESESRTVIKVDYIDIDLSQTTLRQKRPREIELVVETEDNKLIVRRPVGDRSDQIAAALKVILDEKASQDLDEEVIALTGVADPAVRTQFFIDMINSIPECDFLDVTAVKVSHDVASAADDENSDENGDTEDEESRDIEDEMAGVVRAALEGVSILNSPVFQRLRERGFFIYRIRWQSSENATGHNIEFEASFADPAAGQQFQYDATGIYRHKEGGGHTTRRALLPRDRETYVKRVEVAARNALQNLRTNGASDEHTEVPMDTTAAE